MNAIESVILESADPAATEAFLAAAFGIGDQFTVRAAEAPSTGFRGYNLSLVVSQPSTVDSLYNSALEAGAVALKPAAKSFWGYGCTLQDPDGAIWTIASSSKKDTGPATREIDQVVFLLGAADVAATKKFYEAHGFPVAKSYGRKYVEFEAPEKGIKLALYGHRHLAKNAGVSAEGTGSHRVAFRGGEAFTDPDGFAWETAAQR